MRDDILVRNCIMEFFPEARRHIRELEARRGELYSDLGVEAYGIDVYEYITDIVRNGILGDLFEMVPVDRHMAERCSILLERLLSIDDYVTDAIALRIVDDMLGHRWKWETFRAYAGPRFIELVRREGQYFEVPPSL